MVSSSPYLVWLTFYPVFTALYLILHWTIHAQAVRALGLNRAGRLALGAGLGLMALGPGLLALTGRHVGLLPLAVYVWMALAFYLFLGCLLLWPLRWVKGGRYLRVAFLAMVGLAVATVAYGYQEARRPVVREVLLPTTKLAAGLKSLTVAVISDVHLASVEAETRLDRLIKTLQPLKYDLLVSLGDLIEVGLDEEDWPPLAKRLAQLKPRLGKYAIRGNHEHYADRTAGVDFSAKFHQAAGFTLLVGEAEVIPGVVQLVGLDDPRSGLSRNAARTLEINLLNRLDHSRPILLLKHRPEVEETTAGLYDLQLSGHTHGGQMWPWSYLVRLANGRLQGLYELAGGSRLYVTAGFGCWGPPVRVGTGAEVTLVRLVQY